MLFSIYNYLTNVIIALVGNQTIKRDSARALILWVEVQRCPIPVLYQGPQEWEHFDLACFSLGRKSYSLLKEK